MYLFLPALTVNEIDFHKKKKPYGITILFYVAPGIRLIRNIDTHNGYCPWTTLGLFEALRLYEQDLHELLYAGASCP